MGPRSGVEEERRQAFLAVLLGRPVSELMRRLSAGEEVTIACGDGEAELPLGLAAWREILGADEKELNAGSAFLHFVKAVPASRMLVALLSVDARAREELRTLAGPPGGAGGWKLLYDEVLDGFARFPEALVVRDGRIRLPGGEAADAVWEDVVGVPPSDRAEFAVKLLGADSGKPAYVVDALRFLAEADARALVLGRTGDPEAAVKRFRRLYGSIERSGGGFARSRREPYDFAHLVRFLKLADDGEVVVPGGAELWLEALGSSRFPEDEPELSRILADVRTGQVSSEGLLPQLIRREPPGSARAVPVRKQFLVVSSLVEARPVLADAGTIVLLFRGMERLLASYAPLEELPLDDPVVVRRYLFTLNRLDTSGTGRPAELRAGLFQASIDLLAALCRSRALPDSKARALLRSLLDVPLFAMPKLDPADGIGAFEGWLRGELVGALREEEAAFLAKARADVARRDPDGELPEPARTTDDLVAAALAGWRPPVTFAWRGGRYRYDPTSDGAARRRAFAATQEYVPLADLAEAVAEREKATQAARTGDAEGMRASVGAYLERLAAARPPGRDEDERILWVVARARLAFGELRPAAKDDALARLEERLGHFDALRAERTLEALAVHVYSSSVTDPAGLPYTDGLFVRRHSLSWGGPTGGETVSPFGPTRLERLGEGRGSRIGGSFSGLADTLGLLHAEELVYDARAPATNEQIRAGLIAPVTHVTPARLDDDALRFVALACRASEQLADGAGEASRSRASRNLERAGRGPRLARAPEFPCRPRVRGRRGRPDPFRSLPDRPPPRPRDRRRRGARPGGTRCTRDVEPPRLPSRRGRGVRARRRARSAASRVGRAKPAGRHGHAFVRTALGVPAAALLRRTPLRSQDRRGPGRRRRGGSRGSPPAHARACARRAPSGREDGPSLRLATAHGDGRGPGEGEPRRGLRTGSLGRPDYASRGGG